MLKIVFRLFLVISTVSSSILYDSLISFGDSNTDTGNVYTFLEGRWPMPPYYRGRFSDGPIWIDQLGIANFTNYAFGGATSDNDLVKGYTAYTTLVPGVRQQILTFKNRTNSASINFDRTIFVVWIGANDYFRNLTISPSSVVTSIVNSIQDLISIGAQHFLVMNQPPFHRQPVAMGFNDSTILSSIVSNHNTILSQSIQSLQSTKSNVTFQIIDINSLINRILNNLSTYGINNTNVCWLTSTTSGITQLYNNTNNSIFIDQYHYTTRVHRYIADEIRSAISSDGSSIVQLSIFLLIFMWIFHFSLYFEDLQ